MTQWAPFLALTAVVVVSLLALARLSSGVLRDDTQRGSTRSASPTPDRLGEPVAGESTLPTAASSTETAGRGSPDPADPESPNVPTAAHPAGDRATELPRPMSAPTERVEFSSWMLLANVALTQGVVGVALLAGAVWFEIPWPALGLSADPWIGGLPAVAVGLAFGLALWVGNEVAASVADAVGATYDEAVRRMLAPDSRLGWAVLLGLVLPTVALVEELLFRGALIGAPAAATGVSPWLLAVVSSGAFALGHGAQGRVGVAVTGVLGLVLAAGYVLTGSLLVVIVAHYVVNVAEFVVHEGLGFDRLW